MPRKKTGYIRKIKRPGKNGRKVTKLYAFWDYIDHQGSPRSKSKLVKNPTEAERFFEQKREEEKTDVQVLENDSMTFAEYAGLYEQSHLGPPVVRDGKHLLGLKSYASRKSALVHLITYFGKRQLNSIKKRQVMLYKKARLHSTLKNGDFVKLATVNRELELLRHMLNQADDILIRVPSFRGMISKKQEDKRNRVLSHDEEMRLLAACETGDKQGRFKRLHVRPILICALDTAMRKGEILRVEWRDVDFDKNYIRIRAENTKTSEERGVPISARLRNELESMRTDQRPAPSDKVFRRKILGHHAGKQVSEARFVDVASNFQTAFEGIRKDASVENYVFHDNRHTATTRFILSGMKESLVRKITGHRTLDAFNTYLNPDDKALNDEFVLYESYRAAMTTNAASETEMVN